MEPLATYDELTLHLGRTPDQDIAEQALILASGAVRAYCRWDLTYTTGVQMEVYGDGSRVLHLPTLLLLGITQIVDGTTDVDLATVTYARKGQIFRDSGWCKDAIVRVVCDHGYNPIPDAVKLVTLDAAARQLTNPENLVSATTGEVSRTWSSSSGGATGTLTTLHMALLDNYRLFT